MKRIVPALALLICLFSVSCQKELENNTDKYCHCGDPRPISPDGHIPEISWADYNSVQDVCFHFERFVRGWDIFTGRLREFNCLDHIGDTLKVYGWLYNAENTCVDPGGNWIANDPKYASGLEKYPPWGTFIVGYGERMGEGFGEGFRLKNLHVTDSSLIKNKCFVTGTIGYTSGYTELGELGAKDGCCFLGLKLKVIDIYFEETEK